MARYEAGETLASIARTYDCSPPAISYVVNRSRAQGALPTVGAPSSLTPPEPQLVKSHVTEGSLREPAQGAAMSIEPPASNPAPDPPRVETPGAPNGHEGALSGEGEGAEPHPSAASEVKEAAHGNLSRSPDPAFAPLQSSELRHTLHLSLPHGPDPSASDLQSYGTHRADLSAEPSAPPPAAGLQSFGQPGRQGEHGAPLRLVPEPQLPKDGGAFIDKALRERVESDITAFLAAFDAALTHDTSESRTGLREATDRLLRAGARTRIELERLEARMPLTSRNNGKQLEPAWRQR
jgi:hypothetical protein